MAKVLTAKTGTETIEVHMLNPGEVFPGFGGSCTGLLVGKTASLVTRHISRMGTVDRELDILNLGFWKWIAGVMRGDEKVDSVVADEAREEPKPRQRRK